MQLYNVTILGNENHKEVIRWVSACENLSNKVNYTVVDITRHNWLEMVIDSDPDLLLTKPGGLTSTFKNLYDERLIILVKELGFKCFPKLDEVLIYENKRYLSYWLKAHNIPHPKTYVFYFQDEAIEFLNSFNFPLVAKVNIGASGSGITVLHDIHQYKDYVYRTFSGKGAYKRSGPNLKKGSLLKRGSHYIFYPGKIVNKIKTYKAKAGDIQDQFVIFQEYIQHSFEWRVVRMGKSFFSHKKVKKGAKASGSLMKEYDKPPLSILDFVKEITDRFGFYSQAVDIFETENGYLVNEMQCIFGQSDPYQMMVNGKPGRYTHQDGGWIFEEGNYNENESYNLRLQVALELYKEGVL